MHCDELGRNVERARSSAPDLSRSRDVGPSDLDLALRACKESNSLGNPRSFLYKVGPKLRLQICQAITLTCNGMNWLGRSKERDLYFQTPPHMISTDPAMAGPEIYISLSGYAKRLIRRAPSRTFYKLRTKTQAPNQKGNYAYFHCKELGRGVERARSSSPDPPF